MTREQEIAKLDTEQALHNFAIETDPARHDEPPKLDFDRLAICKVCRNGWINYSGHELKLTCNFMGRHNMKLKLIEYCMDNARVTGVMERYYA